MNIRKLPTAALAVALALCAPAHAQDEDRKVEVGVLGSLITSYRGGATGAVGGRVGYMASPNLGLEAEVSFLPDVASTLALGGVKVGRRFDNVGVFAKLRPGAIIDPDFRDGGAFALDAGGVVEIYPSEKTVIRFDAGNLTLVRDNVTVNSFQASAGFGWRF